MPPFPGFFRTAGFRFYRGPYVARSGPEIPRPAGASPEYRAEDIFRKEGGDPGRDLSELGEGPRRGTSERSARLTGGISIDHPTILLTMPINHRGEKFSGYNKPKRTPGHKTKSHAVLAKVGDKVKLIRFGQQGVSGSPDGTKRNKAFKARHAKNIAKGKMSAAYWANRSKW